MKQLYRDFKLLPVVCAVLVGLLFAGCSRQAKKGAHLERANRFSSHQQFDEAIVEYLNVLQLDPNDVQALQDLGTIYYDRGQIRQAFPLLHEAAKLKPQDTGIRGKLTRIYLAGGQTEAARSEALSILDKEPTNELALLALCDAITLPEHVTDIDQRLQGLLAQHPNNAGIHLGLGALALRRGDLTAAQTAFDQARKLSPNSSRVQLAWGNLRWRQGNLREADEAFETAANLAGGDWGARLKRAEFKLATGATAAAESIAEDIAKQAPHYLPSLFLLARIDFAQKKYTNCAARVKQVLESNPQDADALLLRAQISLVSGQVEQGIADLERLRDLFPKAAPVHYQLGAAEVINHDVTKAAASFEKAIALDPNLSEAVLALAELDLRRGSFDGAVHSLTALLTRSPRIERAYGLLASAYFSLGRWDDVVTTCRRWDELIPSSAEASYLIGLAQRQQRQNAEARTALEKAASLNPDFLPATEQLVELDLQEGNIEGARRRALAQIDRNSKAPSPLLLLAHVQLAERTLDAAEATLQKAVQLDPQYAPAALLLSQVYLRTKRLDEARLALEALLEKRPGDLEAMIQVAMIYHAKKDYPKARDAYLKVIKVQPKSVLALNNLAYLTAENLRDVETGFRYARQARELAPQDPATADTFGWILFQRREYAAALPILREAAEKRSADSDVQYHLGMAHYMLGEEAAARNAFRRACEREFTSKAAAEQRLWILEVNPETAPIETRSKLNQIIADAPADVIALLRLAAWAEKDGNLEHAQVLYQRATDASPSANPPLMHLARFFAERRQNPAKALELGNLVLSRGAADAGVSRAVGQWAAQAGNLSRAHTLLQDSVQLQPDNARTWFDLAWVSYRLGRISEAEDLMRKALGADPAFSGKAAAEQFLFLVSVSRDPVRARQKQAEVDELIKADPESLPALMAAASIQEANGRYELAKQIYDERVLSAHPSFAPAAVRLASLLANHLGDDAKAFAIGSKARAASGEDPELSKVLGSIAYRRKDYTQAIELLTESASKRPADADICYYLGLAYFELKQKDQSKVALQKALSLNLSGDAVREANRVLLELR